MEGTTLTRPRPGPSPARPLKSVWDRGDRLAKLAFALLCLGFAIGFFVFPTYPVYDSYYSLLWGRDLVHGDALVFDGFRYPTEHPLAIAAGAILQFFGGWADRLWVAMTLAAFLVLIAGVYRLGRIAATPLVGAVAAALLMTRFDYPFLAARGYIDIPYMALVVWAATRPRHKVFVLSLLALAGMLRPEAWFLAAMYWVWAVWHATWRQRLLYTALAAAGPAVWATVDFLVTGDPMFSLNYTAGSAEDLGRQRSLSELPAAIPTFFQNLVKLPVFVAAGAGLVLGVLISPRRMVMPFVLLAAGLATFVAIGVAGASVIERYLAVPGAGADGLRRRRDRRLDDALAGPRAHGLDGRGGGRRDLRRRVHRDAAEPLALRERVALPRPGPHRPDRGAERPAGQGRPALRPANRP